MSLWIYLSVPMCAGCRQLTPVCAHMANCVASLLVECTVAVTFSCLACFESLAVQTIYIVRSHMVI